MKDLLDKISSYDIFNYLFPGILFAVAAKHVTPYSFVQIDLVLGVFVYYFIGLVISRVGSLLVEPVLKWIKFVKFAEYQDFVTVQRVDSKLDVLSEKNNMYRTLIALFGSILVLKGYDWISVKYPLLSTYRMEFLITGLLVMFLFSYRKQTAYIRNRVAVKPSSSVAAKP